MSTHRRIVLTFSPERYRRLESRAAEKDLDAREWALRAVLAELGRPESKRARRQRSREAGFALLSLLAGSTGSQQAGSTNSQQAGEPTREGGCHAART